MSATAPTLMFPAAPVIDRADFDWFREALRDRAGIALSDNKVELIETQIGSRLHKLQIESFKAYRELLQSAPANDPEWQNFLNALTTNKTSWFREPQHFDHLASIAKAGMKIWCAASSTGEEPYTIAAVLRKVLGDSDTFSIEASDLDTKVLAHAMKGVYRIEGVTEIPAEYKQGSFCVGTEGISEWMKVSDRLKKRVDYRQQNLMHSPFPGKGKFDAIFCRNVFIYFPKPTVAAVARALAATAKPGALLYIGHAETLNGLDTPWKSVQPVVYQLP